MAAGIQGDFGNNLPLPPPCYKPPKLTPAQRDELHRRVADGEDVKALATEFGVSTRTIRQNS
jgi:DNA-binding NarL/FixJ family response regulator